MRRDLVGASALQIPLALAALEQLLDLVEVVEREPLHPAVVLAREQRARAFVGEELARETLERAEIHRGDAGEQATADRVRDRTASGETRRTPPRRAASSCLGDRLVHERERRARRRRLDAARGVHDDELVHAQACAEPLREVGQPLRDVPPRRPQDERRTRTQDAPDVRQQRLGDRRRRARHRHRATPAPARRRRRGRADRGNGRAAWSRWRRRERPLEGAEGGAAARGAPAEENQHARVVREQVARHLTEPAQRLGRTLVVHGEAAACARETRRGRTPSR